LDNYKTCVSILGEMLAR